jgi:multicomponent Na+:H+ antiporter subunit E
LIKKRLQKGQASVVAIALLAVTLSVAWLLWSGFFKPHLLLLGMFSVGITTFLAVRMNYFDHIDGLHYIGFRLPLFWAWLLKEIVLSSILVARLVWSPSLKIRPRLVKIRREQDVELPQVIMGNSITLSPGTITIDIDETGLLVHCINQVTADDLKSGELLKRIDQLERR